jgi:hypothetical protein
MNFLYTPVITEESLLSGMLMLLFIAVGLFAFAWVYEYFEKKRNKDEE